MIKWGIVIILFLISYSAKAQQVVDTTHSPKRATILSAILPGAGQIYNNNAVNRFNKKYHPERKKSKIWLKVPLIYALGGTCVYFIVDNQRNYNKFRDEYGYRLLNDGNMRDQDLLNYSTSSLLSIQNDFRRYRDLSYLLLGVVYALNVIDASIDANFVDFDVSNDLSLNIQPKYQLLPNNQSAFSVGLNFSFK